MAIALVVIAIVAATALPGLAAFVDGRRLDAAAVALAADVQFVRSEAISRNRTVRLSIHTDAAQSCWVIHTGAAADCTCGVDGTAECGGGAVHLKSVVLGAADHAQRPVERRVDRLRSPCTARARPLARCGSSTCAGAPCTTSSMSWGARAPARPAARSPAGAPAENHRGENRFAARSPHPSTIHARLHAARDDDRRQPSPARCRASPTRRSRRTCSAPAAPMRWSR